MAPLDDLAAVALRYPGVTLVLAHAARTDTAMSAAENLVTNGREMEAGTAILSP